MIIEELKDTKNEEFVAFKKKEWVHADKEHYGNTPPDLTKYEYTYIVREDGKIVGAIDVLIDTGVLSIESLLVAQDVQRRGIGSSLVQKVEIEAKKHNCHKIWIITGADWNAKKLYESLGYTLRAVLPKYFDGKDFVILDKKI
jgi:ribosomal protein S18 acetylase RimI-like enzyme